MPGLVAVTSPIDGVVGQISVSTGQNVSKGDTIAVITVGKTEHKVTASVKGVIGSVLVIKGQNVGGGEPIAELNT